MFRKAIVKGQFYPDCANELTKFFDKIPRSNKKIESSISAIIPHAGYIYSGKTAFKTLSSIDIPEAAILMGPNHTGMGKRIAVFNDGSWETPFGDITVDKELANMLVDEKIIYKDYSAHTNEHCLEVIVPMLKYLNTTVQIVPVVFGLLSYQECLKIAELIVKSLNEITKKALIIVSSDMNHYEDSETTTKKDNMAIEAILHLDSRKLYETVIEHNITMCGFIPAIIAIECSKMLGATEGILIEHTHSGMASGFYREVVGYAGIIIK
jgi:AmmeMemoRadiSam system protein B